MYELKIPDGYKPKMTVRETEKAIKFVKDAFQRNFVKNFGFERVSAPLFVVSKTGVNDDLNGVERAVRFDVLEQDGREAEIVHSLAKWKRIALKRYGFRGGEGLYTDMNAIRRDDKCDNVHSIYVDQWDWEMVISKEQRTPEFLKMAVSRIVGAIVDTLEETKKNFPVIDLKLKREVTFVSAQELLDRYPDLDAHGRETAAAKEYGTVFLTGIGGALSDGKPHDGRAPDYDDWNLNGDILFYDEILGESLEISSMGIRVDAESLVAQLKTAGAESRLAYDYHKDILSGELPLTIGGGIGQSRLCMLLLQKAHIGEVQVSLWPDEMRARCEAAGIHLL
ncbi:MAG TPA: aspartate--ammonia ligase [Candidatus Limadaptatus stercorigallinarum]|uniref:Aspartate--ammonia ligase n=1 Tax=Candidatus Limadaptatus stercorigallinarum TaxID=2840845 RepID=A0A9D1HQP7_9FIRM|nr:aspartate--ammonia ligase [Christensenellales bacterium]HIU20771.1 aspartate--ammonia ligase [Candidatus Limadaptatus stercorigallinarum]